MKLLPALILLSVLGLVLGTASSFVYLTATARGKATPAARPLATQASLTPQPVVGMAPPIAPVLSGQLRVAAAPPLSGAEKAQLVQAYYDAINSGQLETAYGLLSDGYHAYQTLAQFQAAYGSTIHLTIANVEDYPGKPQLGVALLASERQGDSTVANGYVGYLEFAYDSDKGRWLIDGRKLKKVAADTLQQSAPNAAGPAENPAAPSDVATPADGSDSQSPAIGDAQVPACQPATIKDISSDGLVITTSDGELFRVTDSSNAPSDWADDDSIEICNSAGSYTLGKGTATIAVTRQ